MQQEQSVSAAQEEVPDLHVLPPQQEEAAEEVAEQPQTASYTADMDVSEITQRNFYRSWEQTGKNDPPCAVHVRVGMQ